MRKIFASLVLAAMLVTSGVAGVNMAWATDDVCSNTAIDDELRKAAGCTDLKSDKTAMSLAKTLINVVLSIVGILAVGVLVYGGIMYTTSLGDAGKVAKAKNIIIYAVVGLVVALLSWAIVSFVSTSIS